MEKDFTIRKSSIDDTSFEQLVAQLEMETKGLYGREQEIFRRHNILDNSSRVILVYFRSVAVGCGAYRNFHSEHTIEIKRIFVSPPFRGMGVSKKILHALETWAREENYLVSVLETGVKQLPAIGTYLKAGYEIIDNFEPYHNSSYSVCMRKFLV
jgi:GNAT superfamily N-acetyltransferase